MDQWFGPARPCMRTVFSAVSKLVSMSRLKIKSPWLSRMAIDAPFLQACGYHTLDISPCADGRLQGLLPFVFRLAPNESVYVKAYAGALFDIEGDVSDWTLRELERLSSNTQRAVTAVII
jgi:hypothetical protein